MSKKFLFLIFTALLLAGCSRPADAEATATAAFFETAAAALTQVSQQTATPQPTWTASPTATDFQLITPSPGVETRTPFFAQPTTSGGISCDDASFIADVTIPDNTELNPGEKFTKTWRLRNDGSCTWTEDYSVAFVSGNELGGKITKLPREIGINETLDISVNLRAPLLAGEYQSYWTIRNQDGISFGDLFYVQIVVTSSATETSTPGPTDTPGPTETDQPPTPTETVEPSQTQAPGETETFTPQPTETASETTSPD